MLEYNKLINKVDESRLIEINKIKKNNNNELKI